MASLLIESIDYKLFFPITYTRFLWDITTGMFNAYERYGAQFQDIRVYSPRFEETLYKGLADDIGVKAYNVDKAPVDINVIINSQCILRDLPSKMNSLGVTSEGKFVYLRAENIDNEAIQKIVNNDIESLMPLYDTIKLNDVIFINDITAIIKYNGRAIEMDSLRLKDDEDFVNADANIYIHKTAEAQQFVSINSDTGPVAIDKGAKIRSFSIIDGPAYVGKNSVIDSAKVRYGVSIKDNCKIGGEIEETVMESYSNKHHEGFIGHSYLGSWVNIGAMATTSDLKNNYGEIRLSIDSKTIHTGMIKFGSVICDYSKIGIGMMLNTGSVISFGCNLFNEFLPLPKYVKPFSWGVNGRYKLDKFIDDLTKIMRRRNVELSSSKVNYIRNLYKKLRNDGGENVG